MTGFPLSDKLFVILRDLIEERTGIYFEPERRELLGERLSHHVSRHGFGSFLDLYYLLKYGPDAEAAWKDVHEDLSVQETFFWREVDQIQALVDVLLPQFSVNGGPGPLRIWSAACATGEEPLTVAMALDEAGWFERMPIEIVATDFSHRALHKARRGIYGERSFRNLPDRLREKYFSKTAAGWQVCPRLHARIRWEQANLLAPEQLGSHAAAPIVICRNVFIYFSSQGILRVVNHLAAQMPRPSYLLLGAAESLLALSTCFELEQTGKVFWYVKR